MNRKVRVLIADDHPIFRQGLRQIIDTAPQLEVVCEAADGEQALAWLQGPGADVAVHGDWRQRTPWMTRCLRRLANHGASASSIPVDCQRSKR